MAVFLYLSPIAAILIKFVYELKTFVLCCTLVGVFGGWVCNLVSVCGASLCTLVSVCGEYLCSLLGVCGACLCSLVGVCGACLCTLLGVWQQAFLPVHLLLGWHVHQLPATTAHRYFPEIINCICCMCCLYIRIPSFPVNAEHCTLFSI